MNDSSPKYRIISRDAADKLVRAWVMDGSGNGFHPISFSVAAVDGVVGAGDGGSALVLRSGIRIAVALPYEELEEKIYAPDFRESVLDLCAVTGEAAGAVLAPGLAGKAAAEGLEIRAFLRKPQSDEFVSCDFLESGIASVTPINTHRSRCGKTLTIAFNAAVTKGPFGTGTAQLDMPHDDFIRYLSAAKEDGRKMLDLCRVFAGNPQRYGSNPQ